MKRIFGTVKDKEKIILWAVMLLAALSRFVGLGKVPDGMMPDEAYAAYNAWAIMNEGIDSRGYAFPVYFVAWGSGMNVLYSYLAIPFMKLFGTSAVVFRLPQALIGLAAVYAAYALGKELIDRKFGLFFAFVLAINPWHIMNNRFGLESSLAPSMFLLALYFCVLGLKRSGKYLIASAVLFGATLYCYALSWLVVPFVLFFGIVLFWKMIPRNKYTIFFVLILFLLALPLLLFVAINMEWIPEIKTAYFSIPKLTGFRGGELNAGHIADSWEDFKRIILNQYDGAAHTASSVTGMYYLFTTPLMLAGIFIHLFFALKNYKNGENDMALFFLLWLIGAGIMSVLNKNVTVIHINLIHIPLIFYGVYGIYQIARFCRNRKVIPLCVGFFLISFVIFITHYVTNPTTYFYDERADEAIEAAKALTDEKTEDGIVTIVGYPTIKYSNLMWHEKPLPSDFYKNVVYSGDPAWAEMMSYGRFRYVSSTEEELSSVCLIDNTYLEEMMDMGYNIIPVNDRYYLAVSESIF